VIDRPGERHALDVAVIVAGAAVGFAPRRHQHRIANLGVLVTKAQAPGAAGFAVVRRFMPDTLSRRAVDQRLRLGIAYPPADGVHIKPRWSVIRHCEERSDERASPEAIQSLRPSILWIVSFPAAHEDWIASLRSQ
jgi:hypothetical protein